MLRRIPARFRGHNKPGPDFTIRLNQIYTCKYLHPCENAPKIPPGNEEQTSGTLIAAHNVLLSHTPKGTQQ